MAEQRENNIAPKGMRRWIKVIFALSLSLNFLVIAAVGAMALRFGDDKERHARGGSNAFTLIRALPAEDRRAMRNIHDRQRPDHGMTRKQHSEALLELLQSSPFDRDAFEDLLTRQMREGGDRMRQGAVALADVISEMSDVERTAYVEDVIRINTRRDRRSH